MRVSKGRHRQTPRQKPQARQRVKDLRQLATEAGLMVEDGSEDDLGGRVDGGGKGDEDGEDGDRMTDEGIDPTGVIDVVTPLHVMAIPSRFRLAERRYGVPYS